MTHSYPSLLDSIVRIYKNAADTVIGIHSINVHQTEEIKNYIPGKYPTNQEKVNRGCIIKPSFTRFNLEMGESRVISSIQMLGEYDDFEMNEGNTDIKNVTYQGKDDQNDLIVSLTEFPTIGSII
jgi:hypothetical protein